MYTVESAAETSKYRAVFALVEKSGIAEEMTDPLPAGRGMVHFVVPPEPSVKITCPGVALEL